MLHHVAIRHFDHIEVVDGLGSWGRLYGLEAAPAKGGVITGGHCAPPFVPCREIFQLYRQDGALDTIDAVIVADDIVQVFAHASVIPQLADPLRKRVFIGDDCASVTIGAEVLPRIETESGCGAESADLAAADGRAMRLRCILD